MAGRAAVIMSSMVLGACTFSPGGGVPGDVIDSAVIDAPVDDGAVDAPIDTPAVSVDACTAVCAGSVVESCGAVVETCAAGCSTVGGAHCKQLVPSNGVTEGGDLAGADLDHALLANRLYVFNTDSGEIRHYALDGSGGGALVRPAGTGLDPTSKISFRTASQPTPANSVAPPEVAIFGMKSLTIPATTVVRPVGARAAVLAARGAIIVAGEIDVGAGRTQTSQGAPNPFIAGPGGGRGGLDPGQGNGALGCGAGGDGTRVNLGGGQMRDTGGGGGGLGTVGGKGGRASISSDGGGSIVAAAELPTLCAQLNLVPLRGGSGGGAGQGTNDGGGGGGALQLTSFTSIVIDAGALYAGGAGGDGSSDAAGGGAGGAGGAILLEAPAIAVNGGSLTATGGAGGAGVSNTLPGENGQRDGTAAEPTGNGGRGATGAGAGELAAEAGSGDVDGTGGGGGGAGLIHLRALVAPVIAAGPVIRPGPSTSVATTTQ